MSGILPMPADVLAHLRKTDAAAATLDAVFSHCTGVSSDERTAWTSFIGDYNAFSVATKKRWTGVLATTIALFGVGGVANTAVMLRDDDARITDFEGQFAGWQQIAKTKCGLSTPGIIPPPAPPPPAGPIEHIVTAAAWGVGGIVLLVGIAYVWPWLPKPRR